MLYQLDDHHILETLLLFAVNTRTAVEVSSNRSWIKHYVL